MALTIGEKLGAILAFIPGVSIVSSCIKAFVYYNRAKKFGANIEKLEKTAVKTSNAVQNQLVNLGPSYSAHNRKLWKASVAEMIPGVNIIAAIYSSVKLRSLSKLREVNKNTESQKEYLFGKYGERKFQDEERNELFTKSLIILDNMSVVDQVNDGMEWSEIKKSLLVPRLFGYVTAKKDVSADKVLKDILQDSIKGTEKEVASLQEKIKSLKQKTGPSPMNLPSADDITVSQMVWARVNCKPIEQAQRKLNQVLNFKEKLVSAFQQLED